MRHTRKRGETEALAPPGRGVMHEKDDITEGADYLIRRDNAKELARWGINGMRDLITAL